MGRIVGRFFSILSTVLVILLALVLLTLLGLRIFGLEGYQIKSADMEPEISAGSMVFVENVDTSVLKEGDIITFYLDGKVEATHRIHALTEEKGGRSFITKGDALEQPDTNPVKPEDVIGVPVFTVPCLGSVLAYLQTSQGIYLSIGVGLAVILLILLPPLLDRRGK